jgi:hypothetical protein
MNKNIIFALVVIVVAGASFYGGTIYAQSGQPAAGTRQFTGQAGQFAGRGTAGGMGMRGGFTAGQVVSVGNGSITIQSQNSSSTEIVLLSPSTQVLKTVAGALTDLATGASVVVTGSSNSDGSLTAQSIQIRPSAPAR